MAKVKTNFFCQNCGHSSPKWEGKCSSCSEWNTYVEEVVTTGSTSKKPKLGTSGKQFEIRSITEIEANPEARLKSLIPNLTVFWEEFGSWITYPYWR